MAIALGLFLLVSPHEMSSGTRTATYHRSVPSLAPTCTSEAVQEPRSRSLKCFLFFLGSHTPTNYDRHSKVGE